MIGILPTPLEIEKQLMPGMLSGSQIGGRELVKSMLRYLPPQSVTLFVPDERIARVLYELRRLHEGEGGNYASGQVVGIRSDRLPSTLRSDAFLALHDVEDANLHRSSHLRATFGLRPFPITSMTHGLSHQSMNWERFARLLIIPTLPCDSVFCTSRSARDALIKALGYAREGLREAGNVQADYPLRLDLVSLGVDTDLFQPRNKAEVRRSLGLPQNSVLLLYFGRIDHATKGDLIPLLMAFRELLGKYGDELMLVLAGGGPPEAISHIERMSILLGCGHRVVLRFEPTPIEGPLYYSAADIFVSPVDTLQESFGISPLEAMASGLPAVVSAWSGYRETVVHGKTGFHVTTYWADCTQPISDLSPVTSWQQDHLLLAQSVALDLGELIRCLDILIGKPDQRRAMGEAAREHILAHFDWKCVMTQAYALWNELAKIARSLPPLQPCRSPLERAQYFQVFSHYASRCLTGEECLELTQRGRRACRHPESIILPPGMEAYLDPRTLLVLLNYVRMLGFFKRSPDVQEVCAKLAQRHQMTPQQILAHVLWLMKYGLLQLRQPSH